MQVARPTRGVFNHYLKVILRNFYRNRTYAILNLSGLSIGFAVFLYMVIYVHFETHFENFHSKSDAIYRVTYHFNPGDKFNVHWARTADDFVNQIPDDIPGVRTLIRFQNHERKYIRIGEKKFIPRNTYVTDGDVFDVFDFNLIAGNPKTALSKPRSIVITTALAQQYFGGEDPMGKEIFVIGDLDRNETSYNVTGIIEDLPLNTHMPVDMLISFSDKSARTGWAYAYILLEEGATISQVEAKMPEFIRKYNSEEDARRFSLVFQPMKDIHLRSHLARELVPNGNVFYVRVVAVTGILILLIAVINFMNLNSAMALGRSKEIGLRKILGAAQRQMTAYLLTESVTYHIVALAIGSGIAYMAFPAFQNLVTVDFLPGFWWLALGMIAIAIACGVLSGIYPLILLTSFKPMDVIRNTKSMSFVRKENRFSVKRVMVTLQFCISIVLAGSTLIAYQQFRYLNEKNLGIEQDQIIAIPGVPDKIKDNFPAFKEHLKTLPGIAGVAACMEVPSREIRDSGPVLVKGVNDDPASAPVLDVQIIDHDFVDLLGIEFLAGKNIPQRLAGSRIPEFTADFTLQDYLLNQQRAYLINETAMHQLGWQSPQEAIGQEINWSIGNLVLASGPITGVVKDFHQESLRNKVDPIVMVYEPVWIRTFLIKVETQRIKESLEQIQAAWDTMFPLYPLEYHFLDDLYQNLYMGERVQLQLLCIFSGLAIFIAFTGLIGMIAYALKTRVKEIAIRKVLGASVTDLIRMIGKEYLTVLLIGGVLAVPLSYYGVKQWLSNFAYRVDISPASYLLTLAVIAFLLLGTIGLQTFRTSRINPADTLRDE